jgi:16S rRNA (cytosine1402-N4)-methyltransferase
MPKSSASEAILEAGAPDAELFGIDRDAVALAEAKSRLSRFGGRVVLRQGNFAEMSSWVDSRSCDGVLLDLGVSSPQLDRAERGFSFQAEGPLDMRMDGRQGKTAADWIDGASAEDLERVFREYGEEPEARRLARAIERERLLCRFETTRQLASLVERVKPRRGRRLHPATRVFQALRMVVNDEAESLRRGLAAALRVLAPGGRLVVITFHSIEDRILKAFGDQQVRDYEFPGEVDIPELRRPVVPAMRWCPRRAISPQEEEIRMNPRARSAHLRVLEKL